MSTLFIVAVVSLAILSQVEGKALSDISLIVDEPVANSTSVIPLVNCYDCNENLVSGKKGLTFVKEDRLTQFGIDRVSCRKWADPNGMNCNAYSGDTLCSESRPVLCAKVDKTPRPAYFVRPSGGVMPAAFYSGWNRGRIANTSAVRGSKFVNRAAVDAFCAKSHGTGWRVAEFHDGTYISGMNETIYAGKSWTLNSAIQQQGGWSFYSLGNVTNSIRFWIHISDQPSTCWAQ